MRHKMDICPACKGYVLYKLDAVNVTCLICNAVEPVLTYYDTLHTSDICRNLRYDQTPVLLSTVQNRFPIPIENLCAYFVKDQ